MAYARDRRFMYYLQSGASVRRLDDWCAPADVLYL